MAIDLNSKIYWHNLTNDVHLDAAEHLEIPRSEPAQRLFSERSAHPSPLFFNYTPPLWHSGWDWSTHNTTIINNAPTQPTTPEETERQRQREESQRAVMIGTVVGAVAAFATGLFCTEFAAEQEKSTLSSQCKNTLAASLPALVNRPIFTDLFALMSARSQIDTRNYENARNKLIAAVVILAGAAGAAFGGLMAVSALMTAGYVAMVAGTFFFLLNLGLHWNDTAANQRDYRAIVGYTQGSIRIAGLAERVQQAIGQYTDTMTLLVNSEPVMQYQPVYPDLPRYQPVQGEYQQGYNPYAYQPSAPPAYL